MICKFSIKKVVFITIINCATSYSSGRPVRYCGPTEAGLQMKTKHCKIDLEHFRFEINVYPGLLVLCLIQVKAQKLAESVMESNFAFFIMVIKITSGKIL